jgi:hypothetical protein
MKLLCRLFGHKWVWSKSRWEKRRPAGGEWILFQRQEAKCGRKGCLAGKQRVRPWEQNLDAPPLTDEELLSHGFTQGEIDEVRRDQ